MDQMEDRRTQNILLLLALQTSRSPVVGSLGDHKPIDMRHQSRGTCVPGYSLDEASVDP